MEQWCWDGVIAFLSGILSWVLVALFDWIPARVRYGKERAHVQGYMARAKEADANYDDSETAMEQMLLSRGVKKPPLTRSFWATCMQALITLMIIAPALFWFKTAGRAAWAMKFYVPVFVLTYALMVYHELEWKEEAATARRIAAVAALWFFSLVALLWLANASVEEPKHDANASDSQQQGKTAPGHPDSGAPDAGLGGERR